MKNLKLSILLFALLCLGYEVFAQIPQWSTVPNTTTNIHYSSGKVGIGTSIPTTLFDVSYGSPTPLSYFRVDPAAANPQLGFVGTTTGSNSTLFGVTAKRAAGQSVNGGASMFILEYDATNLLPQTAPNKSALSLRNDDVWNGYLAFSSSNVYDPNATYIDYQSRLFEINGNVGSKFARTNISTQHSDHYRWEFDGAEKMRVTSTGSLLIGGSSTTTSYGNGKLLELQSGSVSEPSLLSLQCGTGTNTSTMFLANFSPSVMGLYCVKGSTGTYSPFIFNVGGGERMRFLTNGQVVIGNGLCTTPMPADGLLGVNGSIYAKAVKVKLPNASNCFPDYVFYPTYKLRPLEDVEKYVKEEKHLPELPSAADVERDGINVAEMDAMLLKKIEELTLYMIELKKENEALRKDVDVLKNTNIKR